MTCSMEQMNSLQIKEEYKQGLMQFCQIQENAQACAELCAAGPEAIVEAFTEAEVLMQQSAQDGSLQEMAGEMSQRIPEMQGQQMPPQQAPPQAPPQGFADGGLATLGRYNDDKMVHAETGEMLVPVNVLQNNPSLERGIQTALRSEGVNPERFRVGGIGSYNPDTGMQEFGLWNEIKKIGKKILPIAVAVVAPQLASSAFYGGAALSATQSALWTAAGTTLATKAVNPDMSWGKAMTAGAVAGTVSFGVDSFKAGEFGGTTPGAEMTGFNTGNEGQRVGDVFSGDFEYANKQAPQKPPSNGAGNLMKADGVPMEGADVDLMAEANQTMLDNASNKYLNSPTPENRASYLKIKDSLKVDKSLLEDPVGWFGDQSTMSKASIGLGGAGLIGGLSGAFDAEPVERPAGYDMQTDPDQQYGGRPYETRQNQLMAGVDRPDAGIAAIQNSAPQSGYSYGIGGIPQYGPPPLTPEEVQAREAAYNASIRGYPGVPPYAQINAADGGYIRGQGTETSDSIPANLSDGEFVMTAQAVRGAGKGSVRDGARRMYQMMDELERRA